MDGGSYKIFEWRGGDYGVDPVPCGNVVTDLGEHLKEYYAQEIDIYFYGFLASMNVLRTPRRARITISVDNDIQHDAISKIIKALEDVTRTHKDMGGNCSGCF